MTNIIYIRRVHGRTFTSGLFWTDKYPNMYSSTSYKMDLGEFIILIFGQGLWFGNRMKKYLIKPIQCRYFVIPICDDPTNQKRPLGIEADFNTRIPMSIVGYTCVFITWYPTYDEVETCWQITIKNEHDWGPSKHIFDIYSMEEEQSSNVFNLRWKNQGRIQTPCAPPVTYIQDYVYIHDFDTVMVNL